MSRCVVEDRRQTQSGGKREFSAKANDNYIGSLINTNSNVKNCNFLKILWSRSAVLFVNRVIAKTEFKVDQKISLMFSAVSVS